MERTNKIDIYTRRARDGLGGDRPAPGSENAALGNAAPKGAARAG